MWWNPLWNPRLVEPYILVLVEPWWNWWNPGTLPQTILDHPLPLQNVVGGTLPQTTLDHPAALAEPGGTLVEPCETLPRSP